MVRRLVVGRRVVARPGGPVNPPPGGPSGPSVSHSGGKSNGCRVVVRRRVTLRRLVVVLVPSRSVDPWVVLGGLVVLG